MKNSLEASRQLYAEVTFSAVGPLTVCYGIDCDILTRIPGKEKNSIRTLHGAKCNLGKLNSRQCWQVVSFTNTGQSEGFYRAALL